MLYEVITPAPPASDQANERAERYRASDRSHDNLLSRVLDTNLYCCMLLGDPTTLQAAAFP